MGLAAIIKKETTKSGICDVTGRIIQSKASFILVVLSLIISLVFLVPGAVHEVVAGDFYVDFLGLGRVDHFLEFGG